MKDLLGDGRMKDLLGDGEEGAGCRVREQCPGHGGGAGLLVPGQTGSAQSCRSSAG